jgi:hypothetical protein
MALNLTNRVDRAVAVELACLARFATEALPQAPKRALLTGTLRSLEGARAAHGVQSSPYKAAAGWLARGIGMVHPIPASPVCRLWTVRYGQLPVERPVPLIQSCGSASMS